MKLTKKKQLVTKNSKEGINYYGFPFHNKISIWQLMCGFQNCWDKENKVRGLTWISVLRLETSVPQIM